MQDSGPPGSGLDTSGLEEHFSTSVSSSLINFLNLSVPL